MLSCCAAFFSGRERRARRQKEAPMSSARKKFKVVMLGEGRVGKTSLLHRFLKNSFDEDQSSTVKASMYASSKMEIDGKFVDVAIWDTAGQEKYHALGPIYYRDAHGAVLVYDITDKDSFSKVRVWLKELHQVVGDNIAVCVVANKIDLERDRKVKKEEAEAFCQDQGILHYQCSAKLGLKVGEAFHAVARRIVEMQEAAAGGAASPMAAGGGGGAASPGGASGRGRGVKVSLDDTAAPPPKKDGGCPC